jgi:hypothetical protein
MSSLLSLGLAAQRGSPSTRSLTVTARHSDSCPYTALLKGARPEGEKVHQTVNNIWDECNLTDLRRTLKPSLFVASHEMGDCCETVFGLDGLSTSHDSHVVDVPFLYSGTYEELAPNAVNQQDNEGSLADPSESDQDGDPSSDRVERGDQEVNVTAARLLNLALSHPSNVYIPWCHAEACRQPVRKVRTGNSTLACYWEAYSDEGDDGYYFQLFDRFRPDETVYSWEFLISNGESLGVTEEMQEAVEDLILLGEDSESGEGSESVDSILTVSPVPSVGE